MERIKEIAVKYALSAEHIGNTVPDNLEIRVDGKLAVTAAVSELSEAWDRRAGKGAARGDGRATGSGSVAEKLMGLWQRCIGTGAVELAFTLSVRE